MKFFYCVRAAHSPVPNIDQNAVIYDLQANRFQTNNRLLVGSESTDHEQSSDADSDVRSDRVKAEPDLNGQTSQEGSIDSTSHLGYVFNSIPLFKLQWLR